MNIYDISKQAGVSIATVSRVLNGSDKVSPATREKVLKVMEQNSYTPNAFARSLGLNSMHTVGILCADSSDGDKRKIHRILPLNSKDGTGRKENFFPICLSYALTMTDISSRCALSSRLMHRLASCMADTCGVVTTCLLYTSYHER